ncbi:type II toxin-antitoxin system death-on-curing family toxin [Pantoea ananatis]|uniref:type II toxin-antitoxin system death-on-curing family toxin n=1 Tax=Pantoea ananas TaxID=553 RepID=UPI00222178C1|nr:type II toxin-antitoxin system death-on-curing family toxin [Pantoea ananatis]MCW1832031.1 type II toxin-antitoxin system death-on-curing family toxin [Pantoea ananatis]
MDNITFLSVDEIVAIQQTTLPHSGQPDRGKLEGAVSRVQNLLIYEECDDLFKFAAMYMVAIAKAHAFNDANKRTAFQATSVFLMLNGYELNPYSMELVKLTIFAATGEADCESTALALKLLSDYKNELLTDTLEGY